MKKRNLVILGVGTVAALGTLSIGFAIDKKTDLSSGKQIEAENNLKTILNTRKPRPKPEAIQFHEGGSSATPVGSITANFEDNCTNDELQYQEIERQVLHVWEEGLSKKKVSQILATLSSDAKLPDFGGANRSLSRNDGVISEMKWDGAFSTAISERGLQGKSLEKYLGDFSAIEDVSLTGVQIAADRGMRNPDMSIKEARITARYDLRARDKNKNLRNDRGTLEFLVQKDGKGLWKVSQVRGAGFETLASTQPVFREITREAGLNGIPSYTRTEAIRRGGYALAMADFDGDGNVDMFVGAKGPATLLKGDGKGRFTPVKDSGIGEHTLVKSAIFGDFSNTGRKDLLVVRFTQELADGSTVPDAQFRRNDVILYKNLGNGKFKRDDSIKNDARTGYAMPIAAADFNKDGFLDFYVGFPGNKDFTSLDDANGYPASVKVQGLFVNNAGKGFTMVKDEGVLPEAFDKKTLRQKLFPHSAIAVDFNQDGNVDIVTIDDRANLSPAYQNKGDGTFVQVNENIGVQNDSFGMGVAAIDYDNDGVMDLMITNVGFQATRRMNTSCRANWGTVLYPRFEKTPDLRLFKGMGGGKFAEVTQAVGLDNYGEGLAGVEFIDFNHDGLPDIYVKNGLWSGTDRHQDLSSDFIRARPYLLENKSLAEVKDKSQSAIMDILSFFKGDVTTGKRGSARPHMAGFQRNRLYRNDGNGHFTEVGYMAGVDSIADGYVVAKTDFNKDGAQDLVLRNGDPGSEDVKFAPIQVYQNMNPYQTKTLAIRLEGSKSNRDGVGAEVTVTAKGQTQLQQLISNNGTVQSEKVLIFGLGKEDKAEVVKVKWPSGIVQTLKNVPAGSVLIQEQGTQSPLAQNLQ